MIFLIVVTNVFFTLECIAPKPCLLFHFKSCYTSAFAWRDIIGLIVQYGGGYMAKTRRSFEVLDGKIADPFCSSR